MPQAEINTLANLLVTCVNSDGNSGCDPLFSNAPGLDGSRPTDTIAALLNITHKPGANIPALFTASKITTTFQPALTAAPNDWSLALTFHADNLAGPYFPAIDSAGNVWVPGYVNNNLTEFDATGKILSGKGGFTGGGLNLPFSIAIDAHDNPWVINFGPVNAATVSKFSTTGAALTSSPYACATACFFPAFDASQNLWISGSDRTTVLAPDGSLLKKFATTGFDSGIAVSSTGTVFTIGATAQPLQHGPLHHRLHHLRVGHRRLRQRTDLRRDRLRQQRLVRQQPEQRPRQIRQDRHPPLPRQRLHRRRSQRSRADSQSTAATASG